MVVVLPAPLGPSRQNTRSRSMAYLRAEQTNMCVSHKAGVVLLRPQPWDVK